MGCFILEQFTVEAHPALSHSLNVLFIISEKNEDTECDSSQFGENL